MPSDQSDDHRLVVIGASAGGVQTLRRVVAGLPDDLPATVCIVLHIAPGSPSALAAILGRAGRLPCRPARDGELLRPMEILVAPPDHHLVIDDRKVGLTVGPRENGHRPSVDALFRSAARAHAERVLGVVLSGTRDDGTAGLAEIKARGGAAVVQDPNEALYPGMPASALAHVDVDAVVPSHAIALTIAQIVNDVSARRGATGEDPEPLPGEPVITICPECGGVLSEHGLGGVTQWACRVGHRYSPESLVDAQAHDIEAALWAAVRALEDRRALLERMAIQLRSRGQERSARSFLRRAMESSDQAVAVRRALSMAVATALSAVAQDDQAQPESGKARV